MEDEVDQSVEAMTSMLEPLIMVFRCWGFGGLVIAMYLPIFHHGSQRRRLRRRIYCA